MGWHDRAGVPERRRVAAADVPAGQARPQVHPFRPEPEAFLASVRCLRVHLPDHARVGVAHRRRWRARRFASAAHLPMLAGGRGPHIIRPASSVLGRGTGLAGRGMSAGPESGRLGRSPCPDSPTARSSRSVPPRGWSRRAHRDADPGPAPNSVGRGDHRPAVRDRRLRPPGRAAAARCPAHPGTAHRVARRAGQPVPDAAQRSAPGRGRGPAPSAAALASRIECTCP